MPGRRPARAASGQTAASLSAPRSAAKVAIGPTSASGRSCTLLGTLRGLIRSVARFGSQSESTRDLMETSLAPARSPRRRCGRRGSGPARPASAAAPTLAATHRPLRQPDSGVIRHRVMAAVGAALGASHAASGRSRKAVTPLASAASCSRRLWVRVRRSTSASTAVRPGLRSASSSAQRRASRGPARTTIRRSGGRPLGDEPRRVQIVPRPDPERMAVGRQTPQQGRGEARGRRPIRRAAQLVQTAAREAAARQDAIDRGQPEWQDRPVGPIAMIEPGEPGAQLVEQRLLGGWMRFEGTAGIERSLFDPVMFLFCSMKRPHASVKAMRHRPAPPGISVASRARLPAGGRLLLGAALRPCARMVTSGASCNL